MLWLDRWWSIELSGSKDCFGSEDVLFEEPLLDELFHVLQGGPAMDSLMSLAVMIGAIIFCSEKWGIVLDYSQPTNPRLVLKGVKDLIDEELQRSEMLFYQIVSSKQFGGRIGSTYFLKASYPWIPILGVSEGFMQRLRLSSRITMFRDMVKRSLHYFLQLGAELSSQQDLAHPSDIVLVEVIVQGRDVKFLSCFSREDDGLRKSNWVGENDGLKQKKQINVKQFSFR